MGQKKANIRFGKNNNNNNRNSCIYQMLTKFGKIKTFKELLHYTMTIKILLLLL